MVLSASLLKTLVETGTLCWFSTRRWAVTTTSSSPATANAGVVTPSAATAAPNKA